MMYGPYEPYYMNHLSEFLDKKICDVQPASDNKQTFREYLQTSSDEFGLKQLDYATVTDYELLERLELIDYLWDK